MHQIRLFIMCEQQGVRQGLSAIFTSEESFEVVGEAECGLDCITKAQQIQPDAIIFEMRSGKESIEKIRLVKETCPCTMLFALTNPDTVYDTRTAIAAGADSCLTKTMLPCHLVKAVELTCRTGVLCLPGPLKRILNEQENASYGEKNHENGEMPGVAENGANPDYVKFPLTTREMEIYRLVIKNYSNKEIGKKLFISQPTVKSHVSSILRKLGLNKRTQLVLYEMQNRYLSDAFETGAEMNEGSERGIKTGSL